MSANLHQLGVAGLAKALAAREVSAVEAAQHFLQRIDAHQALGAFVAVDADVTLAQARAADALIAKGNAPVLAGVPIAHKDIFVTTDFPTTAGSRMLAGYRSPFDATVVRKLAEAGAVTLGKLSCDEFAMGSANENVAVPAVGSDAVVPVRNPWDTTRIPGGSSGGSAAAVAARLAPGATGTDTGGSIRQPASFCGITGIKPTYGRASRYGMVAFASSLDQAGAMGRSAEDCALLLSAMCGPDLDRDSTSIDRPAEDYSRALTGSLEGLRIGVPKEFLGDGVAPGVRAAVDAALAEYEKLGARRVAVTLPRTELSIPVYYILAAAEASSNLSRFDGVKFGHRAKDYRDLADMYGKTREEGFGDEVKRRIMIGTYVLSHGYYDALPAGAEGALHDRRRFPAGLSALRRDRRPGRTDRGLEARRARRRSGRRLPGRHLHAARLAGRPARHEPARGLRRRRHARRPAIDRQLLRRGEAAERGAPLPAGHRLACPRARGNLR